MLNQTLHISLAGLIKSVLAQKPQSTKLLFSTWLPLMKIGAQKSTEIDIAATLINCTRPLSCLKAQRCSSALMALENAWKRIGDIKTRLKSACRKFIAVRFWFAAAIKRVSGDEWQNEWNYHAMRRFTRVAGWTGNFKASVQCYSLERFSLNSGQTEVGNWQISHQRNFLAKFFSASSNEF